MTKKDQERLTPVKRQLLESLKYDDGRGVLRILMSSDEIKAANQLVKEEYLDKGVSDQKGGTVCYFVTYKGNKVDINSIV